MKKCWVIFSLSVLLMGGVKAADFSSSAYYQVCFTPAEKCSARIVHYINTARHSIYVQAYSFTSKRIANALIKAKRRGVQVNVLIDKSELTNYSRAWSLLRAGVPVWLDKDVAIAHNKVMIFDEDSVLTGSYNFTNAAEYKNAENSLYISDVGLATFYQVNWQRRQKQSVRLTLKSAMKWKQRLQESANG